MENNSINIAIVDDNATLRQQLQENLLVSGEVNILFTAVNGRDALDKLLITKVLPQVILMDIEMPEMNGIEATAIITTETDIKVLILTVFDTDEKIFEAIKAGAAGYLLKDSKTSRILQAIDDLLHGGAPMSPHIASKTLEFLRASSNAPKEKQPHDYDLSERETDLLRQLVQGLSYQQIADKLFISHGTVRKHIENIYGKLHIHSKVEAVNKVNAHKWFV
jgi:DNA-binding NarL/FixJ family response regulator